ncbi:MAG: rRNA maturation RNase YbeY [Elusimicrobiaceae bacterium]|jgi:probable rRNA maturation factor
MKINIFNNARVALKSMPDRKILRKAVKTALGDKAALDGEINIVFVTEDEIIRLNRLYLSKNTLTDVIAFNYPPAGPTAEGPGFPFGDIFVCAHSAKLQAGNIGHSLKAELLILTVHGALHLAGMDDATKKLRGEMDLRTREIIALCAD